MEEYLKETFNKLKTKNYAELNIVMGNESCDLDSAVSAIVYAAFLNWQYNKIKCNKVCTRRDEQTYKDNIHVAVLNVSKQDFALKTEVVHCLREAGIAEEYLVFRDDFNIQELVKTTKVNVTIVDHHVLSKHDQFLTPYVTEIIDHRPLDKTQWGYKEDTRTTIETVGSCSTLVGQRIKDLSALIERETAFFEEFRVCADLLHSTIILDTVNFSKEVKKGTPHDEEIMLFLENILKPTDIINERQNKLNKLVAARSDVSSLTAEQLLRKDVKVFGKMFVPSFPILVKEFLQKPTSARAVTEALDAAGCSITVLLGMDLTGGLRRDVAVWSPDDSQINKFCEFLQNLEPSLDLLEEKLNISENLNNLKYYTQRNLGASRKQYVPAVVKFLKEL